MTKAMERKYFIVCYAFLLFYSDCVMKFGLAVLA